MDPQVVWNLLLEEVAQGNLDQAAEHARDLIFWLNNGGFPPSIHPALGRPAEETRQLACQLNRFVAVTCCARIRLEFERSIKNRSLLAALVDQTSIASPNNN